MSDNRKTAICELIEAERRAARIRQECEALFLQAGAEADPGRRELIDRSLKVLGTQDLPAAIAAADAARLALERETLRAFADRLKAIVNDRLTACGPPDPDAALLLETLDAKLAQIETP